MAQYSAMLVDLDGTLMAADIISDRVADAVRQVERIIPVSIATGRRASDVQQYANYLGLKAPQICNGGATILDPFSGQQIWNSHMPEGHARSIIDLLDRNGIPFIATHPLGDAESVSAISHWDLTRISGMDIPESKADEILEAFDCYDDLYLVKVYLHYNGWWAVDFTASGVHKGRSAQELARSMGVETSDFIAAGDSFNDYPMLKVSGYRIAMASAPPEMKAIAHYIAPRVEEDGLAVAIEEVVLPRLQSSEV
ncbi:MAG: HAD hydrolase family protein [Chloroflexi bacterium]|nr:HAD hydrolase family protein [Chloroflexota bacterium]